MPAPKADDPKCDVPGCGTLAKMMTDGSEKDSTGLGRKALAKINVCLPLHENWPHSEDARNWAQTSDSFKKR